MKTPSQRKKGAKMNPLDASEIFHFEGFNPNPSFSKTKDGPVYRVSFEIKQETWQDFVDTNTKGMIINFAAEVVERHSDTPAEDKKPIGGPISKNAGMMCQEDEANLFAQAQNFDDFKAMIYMVCEVKSRAELDHNQDAADKYEKLKHRYFRWAAN